jgi:hypothetical protein
MRVPQCLVGPNANTVMVIWRLFSFTGAGRPHVPLRALFLTQTGTISRTTDGP